VFFSRNKVSSGTPVRGLGSAPQNHLENEQIKRSSIDNCLQRLNSICKAKKKR
jgi:hypothetical protein